MSGKSPTPATRDAEDVPSDIAHAITEYGVACIYYGGVSDLRIKKKDRLRDDFVEARARLERLIAARVTPAEGHETALSGMEE
jgi:hypothetical protein